MRTWNHSHSSQEGKTGAGRDTWNGGPPAIDGGAYDGCTERIGGFPGTVTETILAMRYTKVPTASPTRSPTVPTTSPSSSPTTGLCAPGCQPTWPGDNNCDQVRDVPEPVQFLQSSNSD